MSASKITVQRANVILDISPDQKDYYLGQGFSVIDEYGHVIEETAVQTAEMLSRQILKLKEELAKKDAEIAKLKESKPVPKTTRGRKSE